MNKPIYHITPFTLLDFPDQTACILWFAGCNMRCRYCYNIDIVKGKGKLAFEDALIFLNTRKGLLDGVVFSGGECSLHLNIDSFIREIRQMGFRIKMDTNGTSPRKLRELIDDELLDYVALDFKALRNNFYRITQSDHFSKFEKSLDLLVNSGIRYEVRTTVHSALMNKEMIREMISFLEKKNYQGTYYLQHFFNDCPTLGELENDYQRMDLRHLHSEQFKIAIRN